MWETDRTAAREAISAHLSTSGDEIARAGGAMFKTTGDGVYAAFPSAPAALAAALALQVSFTRSGPLVRMALHTGSAVPSDGDYFGPTLNRTARLLDAAHGGQVVVSLATEELARDELPEGAMLKELGRYRFRDLTEPVRVFQLVHPDIGVDFPPLRTLDARPHNLPLALTSFVGRERELARVEELLDQTRLLTLVGVGGSGKTRLAVQTAAAVAERFVHGVWMVDLARLSDPDLVAPTVASTLGVPEQPGRSIVDVLGDALSGRSLLLILDNCEHLIGAVATLADALLHSASGLTILATSREGLGIGGETLWQVPPLDVGSEAIELFVQRARAVKPGYEPDQDLEQIAQVCARLDGMPLAIELAAARMRALTAAQIADRLDDRFKLLTGGSRTALPRQQTLEAAVAWSYDLLAAEEKILFARLSVFAGFFDLEAAETVCGDDPLLSVEVLDLLARLVDKSLVLVQGDRYRLLETIRSYARAQLAETGEARDVRHAHARFYRGLVERAAERHLPDLEYFGLVESVVDNLRAAFGWLETSGRATEAARMTGALTLYWMARAVGEGRQWADRVMAMGDPAVAEMAGVRGLAAELAGLQGDVDLALEIGHRALDDARAAGDDRAAAVALEALASFLRGDPAQGRAAGEEALQLYESIGDTFQVARLRLTMAISAKYSGDYQMSADRIEQSLTVFRQGRHTWHTAWALVNLGQLKYILGKPEQALDDLEEALSLMAQTGDSRGASAAELLTGRVLWWEGRHDDAWAAVKRSLELGKEVGSRIEVARSLDLLGRFSADVGVNARAARLLGAASNLVSLGVRWTPFDQAWLEDGVARVREALGAEAFHDAWTQGAALPLDEAVTYALAEYGAPMSERSILTRADGLPMAYRRVGQGPPLICLAGGPGADAAYLEDLGGLGWTQELIIPDARGTGGSPPPAEKAGYGFDRLAEDVEALRAQMDLEEMSLLAHSAACTTALVYAAAHPNRIATLVLVAPSRRLHEDLVDDTDAIFRSRRGEPWFAAAADARRRLSRGARPEELPHLVAASAPASYAHWGERQRAHAKTMQPASWDVVRSFWAADIDGGELRRRLGEVDAPVLVITGELDAATGVAAGAGWARCFPRGRHVNIAGSGHNPWVDRPTEFVAIVSEFLAS